MKPSRVQWLWFVVVILLLAGAGFAQDRGGFTGQVTDQTGAVVPDAAVKITNLDTGAVFNTKTDGNGQYTTPVSLRPGRYTVGVSRQGFKSVTTQPLVLQIGSVRQVNVQLQVGAAGETVEVTAEAPQLETETSSRGEVITGRQVTDLPLKDRNFTELATLTPGVTRTYSGILTDAQQLNQGDANAGTLPGGSNSQGSTESARFSRSGGAAISANGLRPTQNNFTLDGVDNNEPQFGTIGVFPNPDAIQEFKVETSVAKAETGRGGATINTTYQSGTNAFHGSVYYYGQNDALNALHPSIKRNQSDLIAGGKTPAEAEAIQPKSTVRIHEFGFTFGGPLWKDHTFFFVDYLGQRNSLPQAFKTAVPTLRSREGDFSDFTGPVIDPVTHVAFPGNVIPGLQARPDFSQQAYDFLHLYPAPTLDVLNPDNNNPNFFGVRANKEHIDTYDIKIDHRLTEHNNLSFRYTHDDQERDRGNFFPNVPTAGFGAGNEIGNTRQIVVSDTHTFTPSILNDFRLGWTSVDIGIFNCGVGGTCGISPTACSDLGIPNCNKGTLATTGGILTGAFGTGFFEFSGDGGLFDVKSNNYYIADSLTVISGKHTWKMGAQFRPRFLDTIDGGRSGGLKGQLQYCGGAFCGIPNDTGNAQANMLLSLPATFASSGTIRGGDVPFELQTTEWALFVQDDWKVAQNLTLNLGLRYDVYPSWTEQNGRMSDYNPTTGAITQAGGSGDRLLNTQYTNFGPRVGFAYNFGPNQSMVLRGGYGLFYAVDGTDYPPLIRNTPQTASIGVGAAGGFNFTTGPPVASVVVPPIVTPDTTAFAVPVNDSTEQIHEWNMTWQWEFARDYVLDVGYAATRGRHLLANRILSANGLGSAITNQVSPGCAAPPCFMNGNNVVAYEDRGNSSYDALQTRLSKRFSHNVQGSVAYTWGHTIDDSPGTFLAPGDNRNAGNGGGPTPLDPFDFRFDRGNSSVDRRHVFVTNIIWDLPFGRNQAVGGNVSEGWNKVIGGWQANVIFNAQTGQPFSVVGNGVTGVLLPGVDPYSDASGRFLNPAAFVSASTNPADPGFPFTTCVTNLAGNQVCRGNTGRNQFTGPGYARTDLSFFKNTRITERVGLQFGLAMFNLFNHDNPVIPNNDVTSGNFGQFRFGSANAIADLPPRTMQYRLKVTF